MVLERPALEWGANDTPRSLRFGDTYYASADGRAEAEHVFLAGNDLPRRWAGMAEGTRFHLAEVGFGTGLNFLTTLAHWQAASPRARLLYTAFEFAPHGEADRRRALAPWPGLLAIGAPYLAAMPERPGWHCFSVGTVCLRLGLGDANTLIPAMAPPADAWYLDGFSPAKNPEAWGSGLLRAVARYTAPGGSFATFTAAGHVRRTLSEAGFRVERCAGFGHKRHMSRGWRS
ncbi:MAG: tRNA (5-methylaminomethyl-2-thiouridine)(34)-methyltransferase MnmD [Pseudomonadota bacterium]